MAIAMPMARMRISVIKRKTTKNSFACLAEARGWVARRASNDRLVARLFLFVGRLYRFVSCRPIGPRFRAVPLFVRACVLAAGGRWCLKLSTLTLFGSIDGLVDLAPQHFTLLIHRRPLFMEM